MKLKIFLVAWFVFLFLSVESFPQKKSKVKVTILKSQQIWSDYLERNVAYEVFLPPKYEDLSNLKVLYMNDGQDAPLLKLEEILTKLYEKQQIEPFILIGVFTNHDRIKEYGTAAMADYKGRGNRAKLYNDFIIKELVPFIESSFRVSKEAKDNYFCGFSLGGLSALDIVWNNPEHFSKVGVFSGAFWWRKKAYEDGYDDHNDRIMHNLIRSGVYKPSMKFWFQCGTNDEKDDRNHNGIIDAIEDTLDIMTELTQKGYDRERDIHYAEVVGGEHNQETWSKVFPDFLIWLLK